MRIDVITRSHFLEILDGYYLYIIVILVSVEWCIIKPLSSYLLPSHPAVALASHIAIILIITPKHPYLYVQEISTMGSHAPNIGSAGKSQSQFKGLKGPFLYTGAVCLVSSGVLY